MCRADMYILHSAWSEKPVACLLVQYMSHETRSNNPKHFFFTPTIIIRSPLSLPFVFLTIHPSFSFIIVVKQMWLNNISTDRHPMHT